MQPLISILKAKTQSALEKAFENPNFEAEVALCLQEDLGHYQCNNALKLAKALNKNPRKIAAEILAHMSEDTDAGSRMISKFEIAGPGFINFVLDPQFLSRQLQKMIQENHLGAEKIKASKKIVIDFSSPNIAKELHVGHLRSTIIGDCLANLFEFLGYDVLRLNHIGDWGTQFGMLIAYMKQHAAKVLQGEEKAELHLLMQWYKDSKKLFDQDSDFKKQAKEEVIKLQRGDTTSLKAWKVICDISRSGFENIYHLLGVKIQERGESYYNRFLEELIIDLESKKLIELSDGAKCIYPKGFQNKQGDPLPLMVQKADGGYNYDTTDLAALRQRIEEEKASRIIIVTDAGQSLHFQLVFKAARMAGYFDPEKVELNHVTFGLVLGPDGKKFKTREGKTEKLIDLIYEAIRLAQEMIEQKLPSMNVEERKKLAHTLGISAIKYADLSCLRTKDYVFSYDRMLRFEGNTAVFLLYSYVRIQGIKRKVGKEVDLKATIHLEHPSEISLGFHLLRFNETLQAVSRDLLPNRLADYLYELASRFNAFFRDCRVEGTQEEASRLLLCEIAGRVLKQGLAILGIQTVDRM